MSPKSPKLKAQKKVVYGNTHHTKYDSPLLKKSQKLLELEGDQTPTSKGANKLKTSFIADKNDQNNTNKKPI